MYVISPPVFLYKSGNWLLLVTSVIILCCCAFVCFFLVFGCIKLSWSVCWGVGLPFIFVIIVSLHRRYVRPLDPSEEEEDEEELYKAQTNGVSDGMTLFLF